MERVVLGFGSNLGARAAFIEAALTLLAAQPGLRVERVSRLYETPPLGPPQPHYLNAAALVSYAGSLESLLVLAQHVEQLLGRTRSVRWGARTLDVDLLSREGGAYRSPLLSLPHPGLYERGFALSPLCDVAPSWEPVEEHRARGPRADALAHPPVLVARDADGLHVRAHELAEGYASAIAAVVEIACVCTGTARHADAVMRFRATGRDLAETSEALVKRVEASFGAGFAVHSGVVLAAESRQVDGLFLGTHRGTACTFVRPTLALSARTDGHEAGFSARIFLA